MRKKYTPLCTRIIAVAASVMCVSQSSMAFADTIEYENLCEAKITDELAEVMDDASSNELISISLWVDDLDEDAIVQETGKWLKSNSPTMQETVKMAQIISETDVSGGTKYSLEEVQSSIRIERQVAKAMYTQQNTERLASLLPDYDVSDAFISSYAPYIAVEVPKSQITALSRSSVVDTIYYSEPASEAIEVATESVEEERQLIDLETYDSRSSTDLYPRYHKFLDDIGVTYAQQYEDTSGIVIGIQEGSGRPDTSLACFNDVMSENRFHVLSTTEPINTHGTAISKVLAGKTSDGFEGVAYDATFYFTSHDYYEPTHPGHIPEAATEDLIDHGVNIITLSWGGGACDDLYGGLARWFDHVCAQHRVHMFISSGNQTDNGMVCTSKMGYNSTAVGAISYVESTQSYQRPPDFAYSQNELMPFKPDISTPQSFEVPSSTTLAGGTSIAAPLTAGAFAYLIKADSVLLRLTALGKAILCSGCFDFTTNSIANSTASGQIAMSRPVGAGMLNIRQSFELLYNFNYEYYNYGIMMPGNTLDIDDTFQVTTDDILDGRRLNVSFGYMVKNSISSTSHIGATVSQGTVYPITLTVTAPNGTTYTSNYSSTNVPVVSFIPTQAGTYSMSVTCQQSSLTITQQTPFGYMVQLVEPNYSID